ncbi:MAG: hypothetical protein WAT22_16350, partial [Saprospiraceae bacterium]
ISQPVAPASRPIASGTFYHFLLYTCPPPGTIKEYNAALPGFPLKIEKKPPLLTIVSASLKDVSGSAPAPGKGLALSLNCPVNESDTRNMESIKIRLHNLFISIRNV